MAEEKQELVDELIRLEENLERLYSFFAGLFQEDAAFWKELAGEEKNHALILKEHPSSLPGLIINQRLDEISLVNSDVLKYFETCRSSQPNRSSALNMAYLLESSSAEAHYQMALEQENVGIKAMELFKKLNSFDKDHARRIQEYIRSRT